MAGTNAIGTGAVVLTANADPLNAGLAKAQQDVGRWAQRTERIAASAGKAGGGGGGILGAILTGGAGGAVGAVISGGSLKGVLGGAGAALGTAVGGPLGTALGGAIGSALGSGFDFITASVGRLKDMAELGKMADAIGVSNDQFQGLSRAFAKVGVDGGQFVNLLGKLGKETTEAAAGTGQAAATFQKLGLSAADLSKMPLDRQMLKVSDAIAALPAGGERAAAAMEIFGKSGATLLPVLAKGADGIQAFIDKQKKMGLTLDDRQMAAVEKAAAAFPKVQAAIDGLTNRMTVAVAPIVERIGDLLTAGLEKAAPVIDWMSRGAEAAFFVIGEMAQAVSDGVGAVVDSVGNWISETLNLQGVTLTVGDAVFAFLRGVGQGFAYTWDSIKVGAGAVAMVTAPIVKALGTVTDAFKVEIAETLRTFEAFVDKLRGLPTVVKALMPAAYAADLIKPGYFTDLSNGVDKWGESLRKAGLAMERWGEGTVANWGKSVDDVNRWFDTIEAKFKAGAALAAKVAPNVGDQPSDLKLAGAMERGSKEAYSAVAKFTAEAMTGQRVGGDAQGQQLATLREILRGINKAVDLLKDSPVLRVV